MNLYNYLIDDKNREKISKYIHDNMPELLECDANNHIHDTIYILKRKYEDYFSLVLINKNDIHSEWKSYQNLLNIRQYDYDPYYNDNLFKFIDKISVSNEWGYKMGEGLKYPNLGTKFKNLIIQYFRNEKLKVLKALINENRR